MLESALPKDAPYPIIPIDVEDVDDLVSAPADGDEVHPISEVVFNSYHEVDVEESKCKAVFIHIFKHENLQIVVVYVQMNQISEVLHPLRSINEERKEKVKESIHRHGFDYI